jgi:hypothetical protein
MIKKTRETELKRLIPWLKGRKMDVFNTLQTKDPIGHGTITGLNNNQDRVCFEDWVWWNGDRITVNYISLDTIKKITFHHKT